MGRRGAPEIRSHRRRICAGRIDFARALWIRGTPQSGTAALWEEEAVGLGLIDQIGGLSDALASLHRMIRERPGPAVAET